jgi:hypothetical protein
MAALTPILFALAQCGGAFRAARFPAGYSSVLRDRLCRAGSMPPLVYVDIIGAYGIMGGGIEIELATRILVPQPDKFISSGRETRSGSLYVPLMFLPSSPSSATVDCRGEGGMVQRVSTVAFEGIEARAVDVQVQVAPGLPAFAIADRQ